jgi:catechol 2,3-dioxygenase-like lactoylglutathione lyase family enzyme
MHLYNVSNAMGFVDHITLRVADLDRSKSFYSSALEPLGNVSIDYPNGEIAYGRPGEEDFILKAGGPTQPAIHLAFRAESREEVDAFHAAALTAGGTDNGAPGLRPEYHDGYYGAFVLDPDGHNIEAVHHSR